MTGRTAHCLTLLALVSAIAACDAERQRDRDDKADKSTPELKFTEAEITEIEQAVNDHFDLDWRDIIDPEVSEGCIDPLLRVNVTSQRESSDDILARTKMFFRCRGEIEWQEFELCTVVFDLTDAGLPESGTFRVDECDF